LELERKTPSRFRQLVSDSSGRSTQQFTDFGAGVLANDLEDEHDAQVIGERADRRIEPAKLFTLGSLRLGWLSSWRGDRGFAYERFASSPARCGCAMLIDDEVASHWK
jgi:hypothetical protein